MESQNKLFEEFKAAAAADEQTTFLAQDKLWGRIEQQLDKQDTKSISLFSFTSIKYMAAALLLVVGVAVGWNQFFGGKNDAIEVAKTENPVNPASDKAEQPILPEVVERVPEAIKPAPVKLPVIAQIASASPDKPLEEVNEGPEYTVPEQHFTFENFNKGPEAFGERLVERTVPAPVEAQALVQTATPEPAVPADDFPAERLLKVQGIIVDKAGVSLANAKVSVAGTDRMVTSDAQGKFALDVPDTSEFIIIQSYGNETKYVKVEERLNKIEISPDKNNVALLNDIARYNRNSGMQNLYSSPPMNTAILRQELASKQKQQTLIRQTATSTDPLIIVNGAPYSGKFSDINTKHIKEVKILPDANARALYGERAKNGVIVITLKKGKSVSKQ